MAESAPHQLQRRPENLLATLRRSSATFWLDFMFWWTEHAPIVVWWTRGFFLWFAWNFAGGLRNATLANARGLLGPTAAIDHCAALARRTIRSFYSAVYELGCAVRMSKSQMQAQVDDIEGKEIYLGARAVGRGAVIVTAHLGAFELGAAALVDLERRVHVVFRRDRSGRFDRLRSRLRQRLGITEAPIDEGWTTWVRLRDALAADEVVMIQGDRVMPGQKGVSVRFLGGHILMPTGPVRLALAAGAPMIPVFSLRTVVGRLRLVVEPPIYVSRDDGVLDGRHPAMLALARVMEKHIRANPEQWLVLEPVWIEPANVTREQTRVENET